MTPRRRRSTPAKPAPKEAPHDPAAASIDLTSQAQDALRQAAPRFRERAVGAAGISTLALLAVSSVLPLMGGTVTLATVTTWLAGLGSNALAGWLTTWADKAGSRVVWDTSDTALLAQLAADLDQHMAADQALADAVARLLEHTAAIPTALTALDKQLDVQVAILQALRFDLRRSDQIQGRLYHLLSENLDAQTTAILAAFADGSAQVSAEMRALLAVVEEIRDEMRRAPRPSMTVTASVNVDGSGRLYGPAIGQNTGQVTVNYNTYQHQHPAPPPIDLAEALALLDRLPLDTIPDVAPLPNGSRQLPIDPNPLFVGRAEELQQLAATLKAGGTAVITTGIGGIGKTQLAAEFAHHYGSYFAGGVFWLSFADPTGIPGEVAACGGAGVLGLYTDASELTQDERVEKVLAEWRKDVPRLLIFDNCDDHVSGVSGEELLGQWKRGLSACRILVTSRRQEWAAILDLTTLRLPILPREDSIALLRGLVAHRGRADLTHADLDTIAQELGDLPLALFLAGSFLANNRSYGVARYLEKLRSPELFSHPSLTGAGLKVTATERRNVGRAFALSYEQLDVADETDAAAVGAFARASYLAPGVPFPRELLLASLGVDDSEEAVLRAEGAVSRLTDLGLLETVGTSMLRIHRLVVAFARQSGPDDVAQTAIETALTNEGHRLVNAGFPSRLLAIIAHLRYAQALADPRSDALAADLANAAARAEQALTNYAAAHPLYERALAIREQALGPQHPSTATSLDNLAGLLYAQGEYEAARPLFERALVIDQAVYGREHLVVATDLNNLAELLRAQGEYEAARPLMERALAISEQALGPTHPDTALSLNNLAGLLYVQGEYEAVRPLMEWALVVREQALGPTHPDTAQSLNNLAYLLQAQREYEAARPLYERALAIDQVVYGREHPEVATDLNNLAYLLQVQGEYEAARPLYERALAIREQALGPMHPSTALSLNGLAGLLYVQGEYEAARPLYERALAIREQALGPTHPSTALSLNNLGSLLRAQGELAAARPCLERALAIREVVLGEQHPDTAGSIWWLGMLLAQSGDTDDAREQLGRAVAIYSHTLGAAHSTTQQCQRALAALDRPPQTREEQIAEITQHAEEAVASALAEGDTEARAMLAERLEQVVQQAEDGEEEGSPYLALAAHLRELATRLREQSGSSAPGDTSSQDGSAS